MAQHIRFYYIGNKAEIIAPLTHYLQGQNIILVPFDIEKDDVKGIEYLLLIEPIYIHGKCFVTSTIWKNWLFEKKPDVKLMVACFKESEHSNVLNLLNLPPNLTGWLKTVEPVKKYQPQPGEYTFGDSWENNVLPLGLNVRQEIERFLAGHESGHQQIWAHANDLNELYQKIVNHLLGMETDGIEEKILKTIERWKLYQPIFRFLPFFNKIQAIMDRFQAFENQKQGKLPTTANADPIDIKEQIYTEIHRYVYYEKYW